MLCACVARSLCSVVKNRAPSRAHCFLLISVTHVIRCGKNVWSEEASHVKQNRADFIFSPLLMKGTFPLAASWTFMECCLCEVCGTTFESNILLNFPDSRVHSPGFLYEHDNDEVRWVSFALSPEHSDEEIVTIVCLFLLEISANFPAYQSLASEH